MAHEITERADGVFEFAFTGKRSEIWHGLGQELTPDASINEWKKQAGMDWEIFQSAVTYQSIEGDHTFSDKQVLFRSDSKAPLAVVSDSYQIVQPGQVLEFFSDLVALNGFKLNAAGTLFGGRKFWATADVGKVTNPRAGDDIHGQLLLVSSADGTSKTVAKFASTRTVCNNTLTVALGEQGKRSVSKSHRSVWNPEDVKLDLGLIDEGWEKFSTNLKKLSEIELTDNYVMNYFQNKFFDPKVDIEKQTWGNVKKVNTLMGLYKNGAGSEFSKGTAYGVLNAATELFTHGTREKQDASRRFWESAFGGNDTIKSEVYSDMLGLMA
jgi:phage/plasmid-like protein (TIGR03299 family)